LRVKVGRSEQSIQQLRAVSQEMKVRAKRGEILKGWIDRWFFLKGGEGGQLLWKEGIAVQ
jgi:hypothetical protein